MAVGSGDYGILHTVSGVRMSAVSAGIKKPGKLDTVLFELVPGAVTAGVTTTNAFCAAPVQLCKAHLKAASTRYLLINTGNANAGTGAAGLAAAQASCEALAALTRQTPESVLPFSTGVIGEPLPVAKLINALPDALAALQVDQWDAVARGIMTTDTRPKACSRQITLNGVTLTITGIAKGAGMIKPNMATMLGYVFTDAELTRDQANMLVKAAADLSFNRITVDGDTSTNDCCMLVATGTSHLNPLALDAPGRNGFVQLLNEVFVELATAIIKDGEGASKFVTVQVQGGNTSEECLKVAYAVAESPLVKTALFASDPNWGRILAATGRAGVQVMDVDRISIWLDEVKIVEQGARATTYTEEAGQQVLKKAAFTIRIDLGRGTCADQVWTCDFSHDYVSINADYRS